MIMSDQRRLSWFLYYKFFQLIAILFYQMKKKKQFPLYIL